MFYQASFLKLIMIAKQFETYSQYTGLLTGERVEVQPPKGFGSSLNDPQECRNHHAAQEQVFGSPAWSQTSSILEEFTLEVESGLERLKIRVVHTSFLVSLQTIATRIV
jgi:hypothetical protein